MGSESGKRKTKGRKREQAIGERLRSIVRTLDHKFMLEMQFRSVAFQKKQRGFRFFSLPASNSSLSDKSEPGPSKASVHGQGALSVVRRCLESARAFLSVSVAKFRNHFQSLRRPCWNVRRQRTCACIIGRTRTAVHFPTPTRSTGLTEYAHTHSNGVYRHASVVVKWAEQAFRFRPPSASPSKVPKEQQLIASAATLAATTVDYAVGLIISVPSVPSWCGWYFVSNDAVPAAGTRPFF